jgi:hypothetical protein
MRLIIGLIIGFVAGIVFVFVAPIAAVQVMTAVFALISWAI